MLLDSTVFEQAIKKIIDAASKINLFITNRRFVFSLLTKQLTPLDVQESDVRYFKDKQ